MTIDAIKWTVILIVTSVIGRIQMKARAATFQITQGDKAMNPKNTLSLILALLLSMLMSHGALADTYAPQAPNPAYINLDATQLDQLVAPIALDPDSLVALILTGATYPDQLSAADTWLNQNMNMHPDQRAAAANGMGWDPSVKGLIEFPAALDELTKNAAWTTQLGNAYYNQPGDVMNAVQAMRLQAQQSNVLVTTVQQRVVVEGGLIEIVPVDPAVIYVPYYNPWKIWAGLFVAYPGFVVEPPPVGIVWAGGIAFDPGVAIGVYAGFGWGFGAWAPAWDGGTVMFGGNTYISNSMTVANHGYFGGHDSGAFDHDGRGVPHGFHASAHAGAARSSAMARGNAGHSGVGKPSAGHASASNRGMGNGRASTSTNGRASSANRGMNHGTAASNRTSPANRGISASTRSASANRASSMNHGSSAAKRGSSMNHSSAANHSTSAANHAASANRSAPANRSTSAANRGSSMNRGASANHGTSAANHSASANRSPSAANRSASANRGASASHGSSMANRGGSSAGHGGSSMASRGASPAGHSGGSAAGHAASGHGRGR
jgi:hypothetical protein